MYQRGDLEVAGEDDVEVDEDDPTATIFSDQRSSNRGRVVKVGEVKLPHSCDAWVIGGVEEAQMLIEDLQAYVEKEMRRRDR